MKIALPDEKPYARRVLAGATLLAGVAGSENAFPQSKTNSDEGGSSDEEYVWLSANANLPLFVAHDHPALPGDAVSFRASWRWPA